MFKVGGSSDFTNYLNKVFKTDNAVKLPKPMPIKVGLAILSNGGGYTVPMAIRSLQKECGNEVKTINYSSPLSYSDNKALSEEVRIILNYIEKHNLQDKYLSRADAFINLVKKDKIIFAKDLNEPIRKLSLQIINKITEDAKGLDGIFLPGGEDIPSIWYGGTECQDVYRTIVELTLINEARKKGIPLMGVCRGMQVVNVYNGKTLLNHVPGQHGNQSFKLIEDGKKGLLADIFKEGVTGIVMHHQGVSVEEGTNGKGDLEALTAYAGLVKAAESKYPASAPVVLTQFHPEFYSSENTRGLSANNEDLFKTFHAGAIARGNKRQFITPEKLEEGRKNLTPVGTRQKKWEENKAIQKTMKKQLTLMGKLNRIATDLFNRFNAWTQVHIFGKKPN